MKTVELKKADFLAYGEKRELDYKAMLQTIMESPIDPIKGAGVAEIRKSIRVLDVLEKATDKLELEDADYDYMVERVKNTKFTTNNKVFVDFVEHFEVQK